MNAFTCSSSAQASTEEEELLAQAKKRVDAKLGFLTHLLVFCCVNAGFYLLGQVSGRDWHFGFAPFPIWAGAWACSSTVWPPGPRCKAWTCAAA